MISLTTDGEPERPLPAGQVFADRYLIDRVAGSGGMGTVYRACDQLTLEWVALKVLHPRGRDYHAARFAREAQLLAELHHPHIVSYRAHGETPQGQPYLVMAWLAGEDLQARLLRSALPLSQVLSMTSAIAEALSFAHQHGVVHRDLKPTNLFLPDGDPQQVKLLDFGIARRFGRARPTTRTGAVLGTPEYMAPEQARGEREITPAADLFSLGCVLYECLTGEPPFVADHLAAVLVRILFEDPIPIALRRRDLPPSLSALVDRLLEKVPERRPPDAMAVVRAIAALGEIPDTSHAMQRQPPAAPPRADSEQSLLSLVLAITPQAIAAEPQTLPSSDGAAGIAEQQALLARLREFGAQAELLIGGALVFTVPPMQSAQDQAAQAARLAVLAKEGWADAQVVVVTGKGTRSQRGLSGEVLDRAFRLVGQPAPASSSTSASLPQIRIDPVSAGLLQARFELWPLCADEPGFLLGSERLELDTAPPLLGKPTPCIGRERELATLEAIYTECKEERVARAVLVLGPPGLGKSRLRHEFLRRLHSRSATSVVLLGCGDPLGGRSAYGLLGDALRKQLGLPGGPPGAEGRALIERRMTAGRPEAEGLRLAVFVGELCGVPFPDEASPLIRAARQDPRIMRDQVERAWLDVLQQLRGEEPLILILDGLHRSDALTIKLVDAALRRLRDQGLLVLALARPEVRALYPELWSGLVQDLPLHPLPKKACERLVRLVVPTGLEPAQIGKLVELSAGNPLFLEELIRAAVERKTVALPETVMAMIQARVGRFPAQVRRVLRAASVLGERPRQDGIEYLLAATHADEPVGKSLDELVREEIVEPSPGPSVSPGPSTGPMADSGAGGSMQYPFRHTLVREAVYALVSEEERRAWHAAAARFLEQAGEREALLLAKHYELGQEPASAVRYYLSAAEQAYDAGAIEATLLCIERGLSCGATGATRGALLSLRCLVNAFREGHDQIVLDGREALSLLRPGSKPYCQVLYPLSMSTMFLQPNRLPELLNQLLPLTPEPEAVAAYCYALAMLASTFVTIGQRELGNLVRQRAHLLQPGLPEQDHNVWAHFFLMEGAYYHNDAGLPYTATTYSERAIAAARKAGNRPIQALLLSFHGEALAKLGQREPATSALRAAVALAQETSDSLPLDHARSYLARHLAESPESADRGLAGELAQQARTAKFPSSRGWAHAALALLAKGRGDLATAEAEARTACAVAAAFHGYSLSASALLSSILCQQGKYDEALRVCLDAEARILAMGIEPLRILELYAALADARQGLGLLEAARKTVAKALPILRRRLLDIPHLALRHTLLDQVPENAHLLAQAIAWGLDLTELRSPG